jgi:preprotein translocase SecE subunit
MAKKVEEKKQNKILEVLTKEYPTEQILLAVLAIMVMVLGVYILDTTDRVNFNGLWFINTALEIKIFSWVVIVLGAIAFVIAVWAYFVPSFGEMKKVSWPTREIILNNSVRVFGFILFLALFFVILEVGMIPLFKWINNL